MSQARYPCVVIYVPDVAGTGRGICNNLPSKKSPVYNAFPSRSILESKRDRCSKPKHGAERGIIRMAGGRRIELMSFISRIPATYRAVLL